jgi:hypothetical protein
VSEERLAEIIALAEAATPGPWFSDDADAPSGDVSLWHGGNAPWDGEIVVNLGGTLVEVGVACINEVENARFIVAARESLATIASELSALREREKEWAKLAGGYAGLARVTVGFLTPNDIRRYYTLNAQLAALTTGGNDAAPTPSPEEGKE